jgi:hypothetical protein
MPRARTIKPEFFTSEDVSALPLRARLTWIGLWPQCDDHGRFKDSVKLIKASVWPLDNVTLADIEQDLSVLADHGRIVRYVVAQSRYLVVVNWHHHQYINRRGKARYPDPPVPIVAPEPGEPGHCDYCWRLVLAHRGLSESYQTLTESSLPVDNSTTGTSAGGGTILGITDDSLSSQLPVTDDSLLKGRERKGREGSARVRGRDASPLPPPRRCPRHEKAPNPGPCIPCRDARLAHEQWEADTARRKLEQERSAIREKAKANALAKAQCELCGGTGYRGRRVCDHDPDSEQRARRGRAAVDEALKKKR